VSWSNSKGGSGVATGTTSWSVAAVSLQPGANVITVTAKDAAGNVGTDVLTITLTDVVSPDDRDCDARRGGHDDHDRGQT
jgi:hypothetical protein